MGISKPSIEVNCAFDVPKPVVCYNWKEEGHLSSSCKKRMLFSSIRELDESVHLLQQYMQEIIVNSKKRRVLHNPAATMDVVHPSCVSPRDFTGKCAWIGQAKQQSLPAYSQSSSRRPFRPAAQ